MSLKDVLNFSSENDETDEIIVLDYFEDMKLIHYPAKSYFAICIDRTPLTQHYNDAGDMLQAHVIINDIYEEFKQNRRNLI